MGSGRKQHHTFIERLDIFGSNLPMFNIKGEQNVRTQTGGCISLMVIMTFMAYGTVKFLQLMSKHNPFISELTARNFYDFQTDLDLNAIGFK